jgi:hypothetical protein
MPVPSLEVLLTQIERAQITQQEALAEAHRMQLIVNSAKIDLNHARACAIVRGVVGKNAEEREANLTIEFCDGINVFERLESELLTAKLELEQASSHARYLREVVKLLEVFGVRV